MNPLAILALLLPLTAPLPAPGADLFVSLLGSPVHDYRECAEHALRQLGDQVEGNLEWAAMRHTCPEVRRRAARLLTELDWLPRVPWINTNVCEHATEYLDLAYLVCDNTPPDWAAYRMATVYWLTDLRVCRVPRPMRHTLLRRLWRQELTWRAHQGWPSLMWPMR